MNEQEYLFGNPSWESDATLWLQQRVAYRGALSGLLPDAHQSVRDDIARMRREVDRDIEHLLATWDFIGKPN